MLVTWSNSTWKRHARDKAKGYPQADCDRALADL
jgi:hypothetical protein